MKSDFWKSICSWLVPLLREHKVHATTQESHEELETKQSIQVPSQIIHAKLSQLVVVLITHNVEIVKNKKLDIFIPCTHSPAVHPDINMMSLQFLFVVHTCTLML